MKFNPRRIISMLIIGILAAAGWLFFANKTRGYSDSYILSGTIEATEINLASQFGGQVKAVYVSEGEKVKAGESLAYIYSPATNIGEKIDSPIDGTVLERLIEPGELAVPDNPLLVVADLNALNLKVYLPEDRYGQLAIGQVYAVTVDSFPNETFLGRIKRIADRAEFTPRNVQTIEGRKSTVFAVTLELAPSAGKLKPGMPADVHFTAGQ